MEKEIKKNAVSNEAYKERFQFLLWINDNIICQRYFKIMGFNPDSVGSEELLETLEPYAEKLYQMITGKVKDYLRVKFEEAGKELRNKYARHYTATSQLPFTV